MNEGIRPFRVPTLLYYSRGSSPVVQSLAVSDVVVLLGTSAVLLVVALALFEWRDVRV